MESQIRDLQTDIESLRQDIKDQSRELSRLSDKVQSQQWEMDNYPTLEKIKSVSPQSETIGAFLEWLQMQGYWLAQYAEHEHDESCYGDYKKPICGYVEGENFIQVPYTINDLLAQYFGVDEDAAEKERKAILAKLRGET